MTPAVRFVLVAVAIALFSAGVWGPATRYWRDYSQARAASALAAQITQEKEQLGAELHANRSVILAGIRMQLEAADYAGAMNAAARFVPAADPELLDLYRAAARAESDRQRTDEYRALLARDCSGALAREQAARILNERDGKSTGTPAVNAPDLAISRLTGAAGREPVLAYLRDRKPPEEAHGTHSNWFVQLQHDHFARPLPEYLAALAGPSADALICVWEIKGSRADGARTVAFTMTVWLLPRPDGKGLQPTPLAYAERKA